jgi:hypothetical protein
MPYGRLSARGVRNAPISCPGVHCGTFYTSRGVTCNLLCRAIVRTLRVRWRNAGTLSLFPISFHLAHAYDVGRLIDLYSKLHSNLHSKPSTLKVLHETSATCIALAWSTPLFELYAMAPANTSRAALAQSANKIIQWVRREEERVFIIGGAVF